MPVMGRKFVVIGGAGLVGSAVSHALITQHGADVIICDNFGSVKDRKWANLPAAIDDIWTPESLLGNLDKAWRDIGGVVLLADGGHHSQEGNALFEAAFHLPRRVWDYCSAKQRPLYWASSSHIYGAGPGNLSTDPHDVAALEPVTAFGRAKQAFDVFASRQGIGPNSPPVWAGYRLSSVYGPNEGHKGDLASLPVRAVAAAKVQKDLAICQEVSRDWVHVSDAAVGLAGLIIGQCAGYFDIGTGVATPVSDLVANVEELYGDSLKVSFYGLHSNSPMSLPPANIKGLAQAGISVQFRSLAQGLADL